MTRLLLLAVIAVAALDPVAVQAGAPAPPRTTTDKFAYSEVVVRAKVTAIAADTVAAPWHYNEKNKATYKVATVVIETAFAGAEKVKEIKVAFVPPVKPEPNAKPPRRPATPPPELKEGQDVLLFLCKHPKADFYVLPATNPPVELKGEQGKAELDAVKRFAAALADPMKGLKSDKAEVRAETAAFLVIKYRASTEFVREVDQVALPAEENKLIFAALLEGDWRSMYSHPPANDPHPLSAFYRLNLTEKEGWIPPVIAPAAPGTPPPDYGLVAKDAFTKWRAGPGKDYVIKRLVPKTK